MKKVIVDCPQEIPCNPCETICKFSAITVGKDFIHKPKVDYEKCVGCGMCVANCPGQACFVMDLEYDTDRKLATIDVPYERLPLPKQADTVTAVDNEGTILGKVQINAVRTAESYHKTAVVTLIGSTDIILKTRGFAVEERKND